jgi:hypothetical protein
MKPALFYLNMPKMHISDFDYVFGIFSLLNLYLVLFLSFCLLICFKSTIDQVMTPDYQLNTIHRCGRVNMIL